MNNPTETVALAADHTLGVYYLRHRDRTSSKGLLSLPLLSFDWLDLARSKAWLNNAINNDPSHPCCGIVSLLDEIQDAGEAQKCSVVQIDTIPDNVIRARKYALRAHGGQKYGEEPYVNHLDEVVLLLAPYGETAQIVGYLHDVVEDTEVTRVQISTDWHDPISRLVGLVTDEHGRNRRERKDLTNDKLRRVTGLDTTALIVKAADRLANLRRSAKDVAGGKLDMYRREHPAFREAAYRPDLCDELWAEMDGIINQERS